MANTIAMYCNQCGYEKRVGKSKRAYCPDCGRMSTFHPKDSK